MTNLTPEQRALGRENANRALGMTRRDMLKAAAAAPALGAFYFGYEKMDKPPVRAAIIGTGNEGCQAMIRDHNRDYLDFIGFCDIRPSQQERAVKEFSNHKQYGPADAKKLKKYADAQGDARRPRRRDGRHRPAALAARPDRHRGDEGGQARLLREADGALGQRVQGDVPGRPRDEQAPGDRPPAALLGPLRQRQLPGPERPPRRHPPHPRPLAPQQRPAPDRHGQERQAGLRPQDRRARSTSRDEKGNIVYLDGWKPAIPEDDKNVDFAKYGYKSLDELVRWRLYNRTGAGLMAELGSHQLDACSIFLGKKHPLAVTGIGGTFFYTDGREVDDHVFVTFEFPGKDYEPGEHGQGGPRRRHLLVDQHQRVRELRRDA